ncbi:hypothetical protein T040910_055 [Synechococcus phage S-CAM3]|uniref:Uncharacterized protein n=1 Tax=Synechococcus phage S-CAM3 TaxID=1883366 RepID=A0A1D8KIT4_9CAUD|nr:hypothetical protein BOW87_gp203 [Synechococcus phage S-CAM3]AOV58560.1 hypothetical protein S250808_055 [Synechococcus phage S-CAM3]AOV58799.1 hypothetical protein T040910_055 [Synechococcus phage S-CAM3]AOV59038.1 hypothetical protein C421010_055 [Synechococcus phage S-CAM3]
MPNYRKLPHASSCPEPSWYSDLELPTGKTFHTLRREVVTLSTIEVMNEHGQVVNIARAVGTDKENVAAIANSIRVNGVLLDVQPPFVGTNGRLYDGYTRYEGFISGGFDQWTMNVIEPKKGYSWDDVWDEVGLGANNHPPSKPATKTDFKKRLIAWAKRQETTPTQGQCIDWINDIPHSFSSEIVTNIATDCLQTAKADATMESVSSNRVRVRSYEAGIKSNVPINLSGNTTYIKRAFFEALERVAEEVDNNTDDLPTAVGYTDKVPADEVDAVRAAGVKKINKWNDLFELAFQMRLRKGEAFKLIDLQYHMPQVIGEEFDLIPVE